MAEAGHRIEISFDGQPWPYFKLICPPTGCEKDKWNDCILKTWLEEEGAEIVSGSLPPIPVEVTYNSEGAPTFTIPDPAALEETRD